MGSGDRIQLDHVRAQGAAFLPADVILNPDAQRLLAPTWGQAPPDFQPQAPAMNEEASVSRASLLDQAAECVRPQ
jgi:hypothetical protein